MTNREELTSKGEFKRIVIVYNERSSRYRDVQREVLDKLNGRIVEEFRVSQTNVDSNARKLAKKLEDGDLVVVAGGDGTAAIGLNGVVLSGKKVLFTVLPYGHFNDMARMLGYKSIEQVLGEINSGDGVGDNLESFTGVSQKKERWLYPLEVKIDGKHFRYAGCYITIGMFAESTKIFDRPEIRARLRRGGGKIGSFFELFKWWRKHRKERFFPEDFKATDILMTNGRRVAGVMRGGRKTAFIPEEFLIAKRKLSGYFRIGWFMFRSIIFRIPGDRGTKMKIKFSQKTKVTIQAEGEYFEKECRMIEVEKPKEKAVRVFSRKR